MCDYVTVDLRQSWPTIACDSVVHLAALSAVGPSFADPQLYIESNSAPMTHLGEALLAQTAPTRVVVVSTGAVYSATSNKLLAEDAAIVPSSPYIVSKLVTEAQCAYYRQRGLDILVLRPFNHVGPGQSLGFLLPDLVTGATEWMETGIPFSVGNLATRRDYTDVRDVVRAYRLALEAPQVTVPVLNVCSGKSVSGLELLDAVSDALSIGRRPDILIDRGKLRPSDPGEVRGNNAAIRQALGWEPSIDLLQTIRDVINFGTGQSV
jgi:GDP-4-dehydro-6-deoxy-D-mannose reductase